MADPGGGGGGGGLWSFNNRKNGCGLVESGHVSGKELQSWIHL